MSSFALYRLPHSSSCTLMQQISGQPEELHSFEDLNGRSGFVLAPFHIESDCPLLLMHADKTRQLHINACLPSTLNMLTDSLSYHHCNQEPDVESRARYNACFDRFHQALSNKHFDKLVLARRKTLVRKPDAHPLQLFLKACQQYPRLFIALVSTPRSGTWLAATPEILLEGEGCRWHTIALAGTILLAPSQLHTEGENTIWSPKNIQEQHYVASYMAGQLKPFASELQQDGPRTVRAANLVHLRSDFTFTLYNNARVGDLLDTLHPTPAVCGLPKQAALDFILDNEPVPRRYYSGFMGPLNARQTDEVRTDGITTSHLYVTLRCMEIGLHSYHLHAGGGLLKDSIEEQEWQETEAKMGTISKCIG